MSVLAGPSDPQVVWRLFPTYTGGLAFDVGANGGAVARILAERFTRVVAVEPCVESFGELAETVPGNVTVVPMAVSDHVGTVELVEAADAITVGELVTGDSLASSWGKPVTTRRVSSITLDDMAAIHGDPDFVKVDTEGHEDRVIRGGLATIERCHPRLLIEVHDRVKGEAIEAMLPSYAFTMIPHPYYPAGSWEGQNHYWLVSQ